MPKAKKRLVMGFGTFDAVHPGHLFFLKELKKLGDELVVVIARDQNVSKIKSRTAHFDEQTRKTHIEATGMVDRVILGDLEDFYEPVRAFQPDVIGLGYDQRVNLNELKSAFPHIEIVRLSAYEPHRYKSSLIKALR